MQTTSPREFEELITRGIQSVHRGGTSIATLACWKLNWQRLDAGWKRIGVTKIRESQLPGRPQLCVAEGLPQVTLPLRRR